VTVRRTGCNQRKTNQAHRLRKRHCWPIHIHSGKWRRTRTCSLETTGAAGAAPAGGGDSAAAATATAAAATAADQAERKSRRRLAHHRRAHHRLVHHRRRRRLAPLTLTHRCSPRTKARQSKGRSGGAWPPAGNKMLKGGVQRKLFITLLGPFVHCRRPHKNLVCGPRMLRASLCPVIKLVLARDESRVHEWLWCGMGCGFAVPLWTRYRRARAGATATHICQSHYGIIISIDPSSCAGDARLTAHPDARRNPPRPHCSPSSPYFNPRMWTPATFTIRPKNKQER
jgi:hypothetical protein